MEQTVQDAPDQQVSLTTQMPDRWRPRQRHRHGRYNVQIAVDARHHLIVAHEVTNQGYDRPPARAHGVKAPAGRGLRQITALATAATLAATGSVVRGTGVALSCPRR